MSSILDLVTFFYQHDQLWQST